jgi:heme/copper-type cytochrome/quinol oxidase subunit 2
MSVSQRERSGSLVGRRRLILLVTALVPIGLFFLRRPRLPDGAAQARSISLAVRDGTMTPAKVTVAEGDSVTLSITSDRACDFHLHGYDLERGIAPGGATTLVFTATLTGRFNFEDEGAKMELGTLIMRPRGGR